MTASGGTSRGAPDPTRTGSPRSPRAGAAAAGASRPSSPSGPDAASGRTDLPGAPGVDPDGLRASGAAHVRRVAEVSDAFFEARADDISLACRHMARRFQRRGRLLVFAPPGPVESDAYHVSVEFVHPVLVGKRALPAMVLGQDPAAEVRSLGRPEDIAMGITCDGTAPAVVDGLRAARERGLLTLGLAGGRDGRLGEAAPDHLFVVPDDDPTVVQEVHETLYHVLWELVHVFFEHGALP